MYRICGRKAIGGQSQDGLKSFSQTIGDHKWDYEYVGGNGKDLLLNDEWKALGLSGQQIGWLGMPWAVESDG